MLIPAHNWAEEALRVWEWGQGARHRQRGQVYLSVPEKPACILAMEALQVMLEILRRPASSLASCRTV